MSEPFQPSKAVQGVQSVEIGMSVLLALSRAGRPCGLKELADIIGMPPSKVHRYLVSLVRAKVVEQNRGTGKYELGHALLEMGLAKLGTLDGMREAMNALYRLCEEINETTCLVVWAQQGPTIVAWEQASRSVMVKVKPGSVLSLTSSTSGLIIAAFLETAEVKRQIDVELRVGKVSSADLEKQLQQIRSEGVVYRDGIVTAGVSAASAPVFDHTGRLIYVMTALGASQSFDIAPKGVIVTTVRRSAEALSRQLGYRREMAATPNQGLAPA